MSIFFPIAALFLAAFFLLIFVYVTRLTNRSCTKVSTKANTTDVEDHAPTYQDTSSSDVKQAFLRNPPMPFLERLCPSNASLVYTSIMNVLFACACAIRCVFVAMFGVSLANNDAPLRCALLIYSAAHELGDGAVSRPHPVISSFLHCASS